MLDWVHHDTKTFDEEKFMEECERKYIEEHTTHIKCYKEEYVKSLLQQIIQLTNNWNELEELIEAEKTRLAKECSHTYKDSLGKTKYVNKDISNELNNILDKMKEIKGDNNEKEKR